MDLLERVHQRKRVGDHGSVGIFFEEASRGREQVVVCLDEFRSAIGRSEIRNGLGHERQPVLFNILSIEGDQILYDPVEIRQVVGRAKISLELGL